MRVLLYSHAFHPSTGGVESVSRTLAEGLVAKGVECVVLTRTPRAAQDHEDAALFPFQVVRRPHTGAILHWLRWADVVLYNGASLALQPWVTLLRKPYLWVHVGYQVSCIDGLGWADGRPAPATPWASFRFHLRRAGPVRASLDGVKLLLRRFTAHALVRRNIAITQWMAQAQPLPRQVQIYNPFPIDRFRQAAPAEAATFDFVYLGRLVSEKGVDTLLRAFGKVVAQATHRPRLLLIGGGDRMAEMIALADSLGVSQDVHFAGNQSGDALVRFVGSGAVGVVPSTWHEPMGGVAVELMAAGRGLIVSARGGLAECAGDAGLTFANGDEQALADCMLRLLADPGLARELGARARRRAAQFAPDRFVEQYIDLLHACTRAR
ncbi:glycosyltransferase family 4 protein [Variovorax sp.]|uniref:glycosyltransferase family 4 protein n=1 Tax=Variovorax sp. TaxID=1871043 RepID=UPI002D58CC8F|nr:glycosyltransferase family 4 protein [Variovorax sp.]HYP84845.1 glycosyltransferase family 4 protein [Variovorax sp.]